MGWHELRRRWANFEAFKMWYKAVWLASGTPEAFNYVGYESVCCGAIWEADELLMYLAMRAGYLDQVCCYVAGE